MKAVRSEAIRSGCSQDQVSGVLVDDEPRGRDGGREGLLVLAREQLVAGAPHDEGGCRDRCHIGGRARADQSGERFPPYVRRHAGTVLDPAVDIPRGHLMEPGNQVRNFLTQTASTGSVS
jgi:hypothetical protein